MNMKFIPSQTRSPDSAALHPGYVGEFFIRHLLLQKIGWGGVLLALLIALAAPALQAAGGPCTPLATPAADADASEALYFAGTCALERHEYREAIRVLEQLVARDDYPVYRADLGRAYLGAQEFERARAQFLQALASNPPEEARDLLQVFIQMAEQQQTQAREWFASLALGVRHDSNVNSGPTNREVTLYGLPFTWSDASMPQSDLATRLAASLVHAKPLGAGLSWQSNAQLELLRHQTFGAYDTSYLGLDSGPHLTLLAGRADLYLPLGLSQTWLDDVGYARIAWFAPQVSLVADARNQVLFALSAQHKDYAQSAAMTSQTHAISLAWRHEPAASWTLEPNLKFALEDARDAAYSNRAGTLGLTVRGSLPAGLRLNAEASYTRALYRATETWADAPRADRRRNFSLALSRELGAGFYAALSWSRARVAANLGLYDTTRDTWQFQVSRGF